MTATKSSSTGCVARGPPSMTKLGQHSTGPAFSFGGARKFSPESRAQSGPVRSVKKNETPGPGEYYMAAAKAEAMKCGPKYTFRAKNPDRWKKDETPAPGDYYMAAAKVEAMKCGPKYSFRAKNPHWGKKDETPAPGDYYMA